MKYNEWSIKIRTLVIFSHLKDNPVIQSLTSLLDTDKEDTKQYVERYCSFVSELYPHGTDFSKYLLKQVLNDENFYVHNVYKNKEQPDLLKDAVMNELSLIEEISQISSKELLEKVDYEGYLPSYQTSKLSFQDEYLNHLENLPTQGYGVYAKYHTFGIKGGRLIPIKHPDRQRLSDLIGYERERELVIKNTLAFLQGLSANNALLYGDAGTGKSSTVKAIANEYAKDGLRLVEVKKHQMKYLPDIIEELSGNPLKFIIFIDDLSFEGNDDSFIALKNILEGGIADTKANVLVYATSNRRHFVKENINDRNGEEIFRNDAIQETLSLAARFGLMVTFQKPQKRLYLEIVDELAKKNNITLPLDELHVQAEAFAIRNNGRSGRTAKQFIETVLINQTIK